MTKLPPPEQWVLCKMSEMEVAEMIERYIDYLHRGQEWQSPLGASPDAIRAALHAAT